MKSVENIAIKKDSSIIDAMQTIQRGNIKLALIVDDEYRLIGTLSDGDIRRALLKSYNLEDKIEKIINNSPTSCLINSPKDKILQVALAQTLHQIPIVDENNKLLGVEDINELQTISFKENEVFLIVGGLGSRLKPLTDNIPKPLLKVGQKPILETIIANFAKHGFVNITLCVNYKAEMIKEYFGDGSGFGVKINYLHEDKRLGTAGALSLIQNKPNKPFFVMNGDILTNLNFEHMLDYHINHNSNSTICVREIETEIPYGVIETNNTKVISIIEKPISKSLVSAGIYILNTDTLNYIPQNTFFDMPTLFEILIQEKKDILTFLNNGYWIDIGQLNDYKKANSIISEDI